MLNRFLKLPQNPYLSFFLLGPRKTGKSFLLRNVYPENQIIDLLDTDLYMKYNLRPSLLREEILANLQIYPHQPKFYVIDEIQKIPLLLNEVHLMIEKYQINFALCGSSARKLKRGKANLLGGRALHYDLHGLVYPELNDRFNLLKILNRGLIPQHYLIEENHSQLIYAYINDYLKEEIAEEGLVRNLPAFSQFLKAAAFSDSEIVNYTNIASDCGVSSTTVKEYFEILKDTMIGSFLPAFTQRAKRKVIHAPKFYYFDLCIPHFLANYGEIKGPSVAMGKLFENWLYNEIRAFMKYHDKKSELSYWKLAESGHEVDLIIGDFQVAIEFKAVENIQAKHLKGLRVLKNEHMDIKNLIMVCLEKLPRLTEDHILILPVEDFLKKLWSQFFNID